jgi:hypothetical protein
VLWGEEKKRTKGKLRDGREREGRALCLLEVAVLGEKKADGVVESVSV